MTVKTLSGVLFLLAFAAACGVITQTRESSDPDTGLSASASAASGREARPPERIDDELQSEIAAIAERAGGKVGVGAVLLETGDAAWLNGDGRFVSQSVYKLPIAMAVMKMVAEGRLRIDQDVNISSKDFVRRGFHSPIRNTNPSGTVMPLGEIVRYSISESDGTASDVLLDLAGGPSAVQSYLSTLGISDFIVADSEKSISKDWETQYRNWATPRASIELLRALQQQSAGLSDWTSSFLLSTMTYSETGRRRLKRGLPPGATIAHKTGTGGRPTEVPGYRRDASANVSTEPSPPKNSRKTKAGRPTETSVNDNLPPADPESITSATNDIGIITLPDGRHILIAVYIMDSAADGWTRESAIADIARAVSDKWASPAANASNKN